MPPCPAPPPAKTVYLVAVGKRLVERHGERPIYTPEDVVAAAEDVIRDWPAYEDIGPLTYGAPDPSLRTTPDDPEPDIEGIPAGRGYAKRYRTKVFIKRNAEAIRRARVDGTRVDWDCHALSMYCTEQAFDAFHAARGEACDYTRMRAEMTAGIAEEKVWPEGLRTGHLGALAAFDETDVVSPGGGLGDGGDYGAGSSTWFEDFFDGFGGLFDGWFDDWW